MPYYTSCFTPPYYTIVYHIIDYDSILRIVLHYSRSKYTILYHFEVLERGLQSESESEDDGCGLEYAFPAEGSIFDAFEANAEVSELSLDFDFN